MEGYTALLERNRPETQKATTVGVVAFAGFGSIWRFLVARHGA
jgi:hypothetical protein